MKDKQNLQNRILLDLKRTEKVVTIFLMNGMPLKGKIVEFDYYTVLLRDGSKESMIYKHAISTVV